MTEFQVLEGRGDELPIYVHSELDDMPLSLEAFRVYGHLARRAGKSNYAWPSYASMGETCFRKNWPKASADTLRRKAIAAVNELLSLGLIRKEKHANKDGSHGTNSYALTPRSQWNRGGSSVNALGVVSMHQGSVNALYSVTTPKGTPSEGTPSEDTPSDDDDNARERAGVIECWHQNIPGTLTEHLGEKLHDLIDEVGGRSVIHGILTAVESNARNFKYVAAVARNHATGVSPPKRGRGRGKPEADEKRNYRPTEYSDIILG